jgi:hypothetical protein
MAIFLLSLATIVGSGCSPTASVDVSDAPPITTTTTAPAGWKPPPESSSGLSIGFVPEGFEHTMTLSTIGYVEHQFKSGDGTIRFSVGRYEPGYRYATTDDSVVNDLVLDGRTFTHVSKPEDSNSMKNTSGGTFTYVFSAGVNLLLEEVDGDVQVFVGGPKLDDETRDRIAVSVQYDSAADTRRTNG